MSMRLDVQYSRCRIVQERAYEYHIGSVQDAITLTRTLGLDCEAEEVLMLICLNTKGTVTGLWETSRGAIDGSIAHPREIFKRAVLSNAHAIIMAHNHPSGAAKPSVADINTTRRIKEAGELMGITLVDHIIVGFGGDESYSFAEEEML